MYEGCRAKFTQNPLLFQQLIDTGDGLLTEATVCNPHWTCGVSPRNIQQLRDPNNWQGENVLGEILMNLRDEFVHSIF